MTNTLKQNALLGERILSMVKKKVLKPSKQSQENQVAMLKAADRPGTCSISQIKKHIQIYSHSKQASQTLLEG